jgi:hypothetical protein
MAITIEIEVESAGRPEQIVTRDMRKGLGAGERFERGAQPGVVGGKAIDHGGGARNPRLHLADRNSDHGKDGVTHRKAPTWMMMVMVLRRFHGE